MIESGFPTLPTQGNSYVARLWALGGIGLRVCMMLFALVLLTLGSVDRAEAQAAKTAEKPKTSKAVVPSEGVQRSVTDDGATVEVVPKGKTSTVRVQKCITDDGRLIEILDRKTPRPFKDGAPNLDADAPQQCQMYGGHTVLISPKKRRTLLTKDGKPVKKRTGPIPFVEGELAKVGSIGLVPWENRFGLIMGIERLGEVFYLSLRPEINHTREVLGGPLTMSFGLPVRIQLLDSRADRRWDGMGAIRSQDWDEPSDYARIIQYIRMGGKEERFFFEVNSFSANSIGHGTLLKRYNPNLNLNTRRVSAQFDAFMDYGGVETYVNDITGPNVLGGLVFLKPLSVIDRSNYFLRSFSLGFSMAADLDAPLRNRLDEDDLDGDGRRFNEIQINQTTFQPDYLSTSVIGYGFDVEFKLLDRREIDWKMYFDHSTLISGLPTDDPSNPVWSDIPTKSVKASGLTIGNLFRHNLGHDPVHALRFRFEYRRHDPNYVPAYFDTLYEIQRVQYLSSKQTNSVDIANQTKLQTILGRDPSGPMVNGLYVEGSWRVSHYLALAIGLEVNDSENDKNLFVHLEVPHLGRLQFLATYQRRTAESFADLFDFSFGNNDIFILKTRYGLADALHFNLEVLTPFGIGPESLFRNTVQVNLNAELGFSY